MLYERESAHIHKQVAAAVQAETNLAGMLRALLRGDVERSDLSGVDLRNRGFGWRSDTANSARRNGDGTARR